MASTLVAMASTLTAMAPSSNGPFASLWFPSLEALFEVLRDARSTIGRTDQRTHDHASQGDQLRNSRSIAKSKQIE